MLNIQLLAAKFVAQVRTVGFFHATGQTAKRTIGQGIRRVVPTEDEFDIRYGTDTGGKINLWKYRVDSPNARYGAHYDTSGEKHIEALLAPLPRSATFIDLGCGKGRPILIAGTMGFKRVIGVEFVKELADVAEVNVRKMGIDATVVCADAADFEFPAGSLAVYLANPFTPPVMKPVAQKLFRHEGEVWIIYVNPRHNEIFEPWMERVSLTENQAELFAPESVSVWHKPCSIR